MIWILLVEFGSQCGSLYMLLTVICTTSRVKHVQTKAIMKDEKVALRMEEVLNHLFTYFRWTPHPVVVTTRDSKDYFRVLLYSYYPTITGWGVLLIHTFSTSGWLHDARFPSLSGPGRGMVGLSGVGTGNRYGNLGAQNPRP